MKDWDALITKAQQPPGMQRYREMSIEDMLLDNEIKCFF